MALCKPWGTYQITQLRGKTGFTLGFIKLIPRKGWERRSRNKEEAGFELMK